MKLRTLHIYGQVSIQSDYCQKCEIYAFIVRGRMTCCGSIAPKQEWQRLKIEVDTSNNKRARVPAWLRREILDKQNNKCCYCDADFDSWRRIDGKIRQVRIHWDHFVPFSYNGNNHSIVAACAECNLAKRAMHFATIEEARQCLAVKIYERQKKAVAGEGL